MKKNLVVLLLVINVVLAFTPVVASAETLAKPTVTLPTDWELVYETPYPDSLSEHDPLGAGLLEYQNLKNQDGVMIYYEKAPTTAYTDAMLKAEAEEIFRLEWYLFQQCYISFSCREYFFKTHRYIVRKELWACQFYSFSQR